MTTMTRVPETAFAELRRSIGPAPNAREFGQPWWAHIAWVIGAAILGFVVPALFAGGLHVSRPVFVLAYVCASAIFLYLYVRWSGVDVYARVRQHWVWGVVGAILAGAFVVNNVMSQPASAAPSGVELLGAILWLGVVYGATDALLLSILPLFATWQALSSLGWTHSTWQTADRKSTRL